MSNLITLQQVELSYGDTPLLTQASCSIQSGDHIAIIGRNGTGKSSFMRLLQNHIKADDGTIFRATDLRMSQLAQHPPSDLHGNILELVLSGLKDDDHGTISTQPEDEGPEAQSYRAEALLDQLQLNPTIDVATLSGGMLRRALLAKALIVEPDILFLDEPTNHLDLDSILWLENFLKRYRKTLILITHDRAFMQHIANRIFELDRGKLTTWQGSYERFLQHKEQQLAAEENANMQFDKQLAAEERWIRQGIKARRTRNEGRVRALKAMRKERAARIERSGAIKIHQQALQDGSKQLLKINQLCIGHTEKNLVEKFSYNLMRGEKIGIVGPNGCGKSSLIKTLIGQLSPQTGTIKRPNQLNVAYFDQQRMQLDLNASALDNVAEGRQSITINGKEKHVISYLQDFLFSPQKVRSKVSVLSGGERNRLLLAKILSQAADLLILDEPSNDLDIESIEILEEYLQQYAGTLLLITHDRALLDNVVDNIWAFSNHATIEVYHGGYDDWQRQLAASSQTTTQAKSLEKNTSEKNPAANTENNTEPTKAKQHDYKTRKQIDKLLRKINKLEEKIKNLHQNMAAENYFQQEAASIEEDQLQLAEWEEQLAVHYEQWEQLEDSI